ncbi:hypothetical protein Tco_1416885 [Tanacetum coccineum]
MMNTKCNHSKGDMNVEAKSSSSVLMVDSITFGREMVNILVSGKEYDKVFNHLDMLNAPLEGKFKFLHAESFFLIVRLEGPDESGVSINETLFKGMISQETLGDLATTDHLSPKDKVFLIHVIASRPDIQFFTCICARKSTSRGCQIFGGKLVCWSVKKQSSMDMSSAGDEYVAAAGCCAQVLWIKSQLADYDIIYDKMPIFCDNTRAIAISNNPMLHSRTRHIDIRYHFIRDHILKGDIELYFVPTKLQLADIFTKSLAEPSFIR